MINPFERLTILEEKVAKMTDDIATLQAAVAHEESVTAQLVAVLLDTRAKLDETTAQLRTLSSQPAIDPTTIATIASQLEAHAADLAGKLVAASTPVDAPAAAPAATPAPAPAPAADPAPTPPPAPPAA